MQLPPSVLRWQKSASPLRRALALSLLGGVLLLAIAVYFFLPSSRHAATLVAFDATKRETPESIAADAEGRLYISLASTGEVRRIAPDLSQTTLATLPIGRGLLLGLTLDADGRVYVNVASFDPMTHGVWRITTDGIAARLVALPSEGLPNGISFAPDGSLYIADSFLGTIYHVPPGSDAAPNPIDKYK